MERDLQTILKEYKVQLKNVLGGNLSTVILYGSRARGDATRMSDIDVLCILHTPFNYAEMIKKTSEITANISLKYDITISRAFSLRYYAENSNTPFLMNVRKEGIVV